MNIGADGAQRGERQEEAGRVDGLAREEGNVKKGPGPFYEFGYLTPVRAIGALVNPKLETLN